MMDERTLAGRSESDDSLAPLPPLASLLSWPWSFLVGTLAIKPEDGQSSVLK